MKKEPARFAAEATPAIRPCPGQTMKGWYQAVYLPTDALGGSAVTADGGNA